MKFFFGKFWSFHVLIKGFTWFSMFLWFVLNILSFLSIFSGAMSISTAIVIPFFKCWFTFKIWVFLVDIQYLSDFFS